MNTKRFVLGDEVWEKIAPHLSGTATDCGVTAQDTRLFLEPVLWRGGSVARSAGGFWPLEQRVSAVRVLT